MRRRLSILLVLGAALAVLASGLALGAYARSDTLQAVQRVTARFQSLTQAERAGYGEFYVCAEEPGTGTMGQHYVKGSLVEDPAVDPLQPEALVYEPQANGEYKLVALEYVVLAPTLAPGAPWPTVFGIPLNFREGGDDHPNRYGLPDFYELHYWLYEPNPLGTFNDWNPNVSCRGTGDNGG